MVLSVVVVGSSKTTKPFGVLKAFWCGFQRGLARILSKERNGKSTI
jgi:hypothetical protein